MLIKALIMLLCAYTTLLGGTLVRFKDSVEVAEPTIRLADIAYVSGDGKEYLDTLSVGKSSGPGMKRYLCGEQALVHTFIPDSLRRGLRTTGAMRTGVTTRGVEIPYTQIEDRVRQLLKDSLPWKHYRIDFPSNANRSIYLYEGPFTLTLKKVQSRFKRGKTQLVFLAEQEQWRTTFTMASEIKVSQEVAVAKRDIKRGEKLFGADIAYRLMDISDLPYEPITGGFSFKRTEVSGYLRKGAILSSTRVKRQADIVRGSTVRIVYKKGKLSISTSGRARQDGHVGDFILVENSKSHKVIKGKVIRPGLVVIESGGSV